jgi:hypothetical protein
MGTSCFCCIIYRVARRAGEKPESSRHQLGRLYSRFEPPPAINSEPLVATGVLNSGGFRQNPRLIDYDSSTLPPTFDANGHSSMPQGQVRQPTLSGIQLHATFLPGFRLYNISSFVAAKATLPSKVYVPKNWRPRIWLHVSPLRLSILVANYRIQLLRTTVISPLTSNASMVVLHVITR